MPTQPTVDQMRDQVTSPSVFSIDQRSIRCQQQLKRKRQWLAKLSAAVAEPQQHGTVLQQMQKQRAEAEQLAAMMPAAAQPSQQVQAVV